MNHKNLDSRCNARAKSGKPCQAAATAGGLCFFHANPDRASELGRIGGRSNRHVASQTTDPLPTLDNAIAVRDTVARLIADVHAGRLHPRIATGLAPLLNLQLRAIETSDLERRLMRVEKLLAKEDADDRARKSHEQTEADADDRARNRRNQSEQEESSYERFPAIEKTPPVELE